MMRKLLGFAAAVSVLLLVWSCIAWEASYRPGASATPSTFAMQAALGRTLPDVMFDAVGFADVAEYVCEASGTNVFVDWPASEKGGGNRNVPITLEFRHFRFGEALARLDAKVGGLGYYATQDNLIVIAPKGQLSRIPEIERLPATPGPADVAMRKPLAQVGFYDTRLDEVGLDETLKYLAKKAGTVISVDWPELRHAGVEPDEPVQLGLRHTPAARALELVLLNLNAKQDLQFHVGKSQVLVSTREALDRKLGSASGKHVRYAVIAAAMAITIGIAVWIAHSKARRKAISHHRGWIASTVLILAALIVAGATYQRGPPFWEQVFGSNRWTLTAHHGELRLWHSPADPAAPYQDLAHLGHAKAADEQKRFDRAGFLVRWSDSPFNCWVAGMPLWGLDVLAAILPLLWLTLPIRRWRRRANGLCPQCAYDLRFSTDRCPECGAPISSKALV